MKTVFWCWMLIALGPAAAATSPASISIEIVTEQGVQTTAPREWLQLLTGLGQDAIRIRSQRAGDEPELLDIGAAGRPRYKLVGILTARDQLVLPGGRFGLRDRKKLADYFARLAADGPEGVTAERGRFGLTEKQFRAVHEDLTQPLAVDTLDRPLAKVLREVQTTLKLELLIGNEAWQVLHRAGPITDDTSELTIGTSLAILLRPHGLVLVPEKRRGEEVAHRVALAKEMETETWPVGWKSDARPSQLAPAMMEYLNAEVDGFTLAEAIDAIEPRAGVPIYWDHATLAEHDIKPAELKVKFARKRTLLVKLIDRLLFQARLHGVLKVDEAGTVFYWISR